MTGVFSLGGKVAKAVGGGVLAGVAASAKAAGAGAGAVTAGAKAAGSKVRWPTGAEARAGKQGKPSCCMPWAWVPRVCGRPGLAVHP